MHGCVSSHSVISDFLWPFGLYPTRFFCPWDSPGKTTGVGCHALFQGIFPTQGSNLQLLCPLHCRQSLYVLSHEGTLTQREWKCESLSRVQLLATPWAVALQDCPWDSPGKNTWVGCHALLQGIFPAQGSNPSLLHCRQILYHLSHQGSP